MRLALGDKPGCHPDGGIIQQDESLWREKAWIGRGKGEKERGCRVVQRTRRTRRGKKMKRRRNRTVFPTQIRRTLGAWPVGKITVISRQASGLHRKSYQSCQLTRKKDLILGAANHGEFLHGAKLSVHPSRAVNQSTSSKGSWQLRCEVIDVTVSSGQGEQPSI